MVINTEKSESHIIDFNDQNANQEGVSSVLLNFDVDSYEFDDLDLKIAVNRLPRRDQAILILHLMGHTQEDIGKVYNVSRSMISKRMGAIMGKLMRYLS